jgi:DNA-binding MarR family transcriptional regulator
MADLAQTLILAIILEISFVGLIIQGAKEMDEATTHAGDVARAILETLPIIGRVFASRMRYVHEGTTAGHYALLHALALQPMSLGELAERMQVTAPTMSATVQTLVSRGWLERERSSDDRRIVIVRPTPAGVRVLEEMCQQAQVLLQEILEPLTAEELSRVREGMEILRCLLESETVVVETDSVPCASE